MPRSIVQIQKHRRRLRLLLLLLYVAAACLLMHTASLWLRLEQQLIIMMAANNDRIPPFLALDSISSSSSQQNYQKRRSRSLSHAVVAAVDNSTTTNSSPPSPIVVTVHPDDFIYHFPPSGWDSSPIVIEKFQLLFFAIPKVGCTQFKKLLRRLEGGHFIINNNWNVTRDPYLPHHPAHNGLRYLFHYSLDDAQRLLTSSQWTRAIFVRDPKERFLSAFLDKAARKNGTFVRKHCCGHYDEKKKKNSDDDDDDDYEHNCAQRAQTLEGFLNVTKTCANDHWNPQAHRVDAKYWRTINFVGHLDRAQDDVKRLLERIGASWEEYGQTGWGRTGTEALFESTSSIKHATGSRQKMKEYYTPDLERQVEERYRMDYEHPLLGLPLIHVQY